MIVDDRYVVCGSANWNDRSMLGTRDCEVAVLITQPEKEDRFSIGMGSRDIEVTKVAHKFRTDLMMEHWDVPYEDIIDPFSCIDKLDGIAEHNSNMYYEIFKEEPDSRFRNFNDLNEAKVEKQERSLEEFQKKYRKKKNEIQG